MRAKFITGLWNAGRRRFVAAVVSAVSQPFHFIRHAASSSYNNAINQSIEKQTQLDSTPQLEPTNASSATLVTTMAIQTARSRAVLDESHKPAVDNDDDASSSMKCDEIIQSFNCAAPSMCAVRRVCVCICVRMWYVHVCTPLS